MPQQDVLSRAGQRMDSTVADSRKKVGTVRTGRATIGILDGISVDYYGTPTPLNQIAKLSVPEANL
ncbi:MAG: ribosome recycling factor, partial [Acidobacteriota bacterium]